MKLDLIQTTPNSACSPVLSSSMQLMCENGVTFMRWFTLSNGLPTGEYIDLTQDGQPYAVADEALVTTGACVPVCEPVCFEGVVSDPWESCMIEMCYSRTTITPGTPQAGPNGSFTINSNDTIPDQTCDMSMTGTSTGSSSFPSPWMTEGSVMSIRDDNNICPNDVGMVRIDAGDRIGVTVNLIAGVVYRMNARFRNIDTPGGQVLARAIYPDGTNVTFGPRTTNRVGGNAGWDLFGYQAGADSLVTAPVSGSYQFWFEGVAGSVRMIEMGISVYDNSGEFVEDTTFIEFFRSETVNDVTTWYDRDGNVIPQPNGPLVEIACPIPVIAPQNLKYTDPACVDIGQSTTVTPTLQDDGGATVTYSISPTDPDVTIDPATGVVTFNPTKAF